MTFGSDGWRSEQQLTRWTESAIDCYERGCICKGCLMTRILETRCLMKTTVIALVRKFGKPKKPEEITAEWIFEQLKAGATFLSLSQKLGIRKDVLRERLNQSGIFMRHYGKYAKENKDEK